MADIGAASGLDETRPNNSIFRFTLAAISSSDRETLSSAADAMVGKATIPTAAVIPLINAVLRLQFGATTERADVELDRSVMVIIAWNLIVVVIL